MYLLSHQNVDKRTNKHDTWAEKCLTEINFILPNGASYDSSLVKENKGAAFYEGITVHVIINLHQKVEKKYSLYAIPAFENDLFWFVNLFTDD